MNHFVNVGFGNMVNLSKAIAVMNPNTAPSKRIMMRAKQQGCIIDATQGRRTRALIVMSDDHVVLSCLTPETITERYRTGDMYKRNIENEKDEENE